MLRSTLPQGAPPVINASRCQKTRLIALPTAQAPPRGRSARPLGPDLHLGAGDLVPGPLHHVQRDQAVLPAVDDEGRGAGHFNVLPADRAYIPVWLLNLTLGQLSERLFGMQSVR